jgi:hypothetical protein
VNGVPTTTRALLAYARRMGWEARRTKNGWWLTHPDGGQTSFHHSRPTDYRTWRNIAIRLRHTGDGRAR